MSTLVLDDPSSCFAPTHPRTIATSSSKGFGTAEGCGIHWHRLRTAKYESPLTNSFWVNVNDSHVPFNGLIEYTRLNRHFDAGRTHLLYIPFYVPSTDEGFLKPDDVFLDECFTSLKRIEPTFDRRWVLSCLVSRAVNVQPVCKTDFANRVPAKRGPLEGLFVSDSCQLYPEDRTLSGMVRLGTEMAEMVQEEWKQIN